jgi:sugar lactone lactonase YvrE
VADRKASFLNDVVVDEKRRVAYISDSGTRSAPDNRVGLIVVDFATATARRVLDGARGLQIEPGVKVVAHGAEVWPGKPLQIGINGIALSPNADTLYWTVTTGTHAHALPTAILREASATHAQIADRIEDLGSVEVTPTALSRIALAISTSLMSPITASSNMTPKPGR